MGARSERITHGVFSKHKAMPEWTMVKEVQWISHNEWWMLVTHTVSSNWKAPSEWWELKNKQKFSHCGIYCSKLHLKNCWLSWKWLWISQAVKLSVLLRYRHWIHACFQWCEKNGKQPSKKSSKGNELAIVLKMAVLSLWILVWETSFHTDFRFEGTGDLWLSRLA